ncbi:MAG: mechanosensitive ion channel [Saprospiraceae bacterium]|nr:mechanosensitive ion channel [Saprospiraceae bacterium]MDW8485215.1 mechanosensitive ion channel [Saprospiraceae bacterium]
MDFITKFREGVFAELIARFSEGAPKLLFALLVLILGRIVAGLLRQVVQRILALAGVDRLAEQLNNIDLVQRTGMKVELSAIAGQMVFYLTMLAFIIFATDVLDIPAITDMVRDLINYLPALFSAFVLFLLGLFLADIVRNLVQTACQSMGIPAARLIGTAVFYFLFITVTVSALAQAKINTGFIASNLTVIVGALALAFAIGYGLAARDLVANYLASQYNRDKIQVGQEVRIAGVKGKVVHIDLTSLILQTPDKAVIVPMSKMMTEKVEIFYPEAEEENLLPPEHPIQGS